MTFPYIALPDLALIGKAGSGKDMAAVLLARHAGYTRFALADPLKAMLDTSTDRRALQEFGLDVRGIYQDAWVNLLLWRLDGAKPKRVVITDVRFRNEVDRLAEEGFITIRVEAARGTRVTRLRANGKLQDEADLEHESETELDAYQTAWTVNNDGSPDDLLDQLVEILNRERS